MPHSTAHTGFQRPTATFGLRFVFGLMIGCALFFVLLNLSPVLAVVSVLLVTPAIIRTGSVENHYRFYRKTFGWKERIGYFVHSLGLMLGTALLAVSVLTGCCLICSAFGYGFGLLLYGPFTSPIEIAFVGATGGLIPGIASMLLSIGWYWNNRWLPELRQDV